MSDVPDWFHAYGLPGIAAIVFVKRMGVPLPAMPFLLLAGARGVQDPGFPWMAALAACVPAVLADAVWFDAGRRYGGRMLALMCRISLSPAICVRRSERAFAQRGAATVLVAKFIPGVAGLAPPVAGAMRMPPGRFTALNLAGTVLWAGTGLVAGRLLHKEVERSIELLHQVAGLTVPFFVVAAFTALAWLLLRRTVLRHVVPPMLREDSLHAAEGPARPCSRGRLPGRPDSSPPPAGFTKHRHQQEQ